ncbi:MAG: precorrin-3B synthase [Gemmobacter sp.]|uniref:precorrin-3B synthase n=1 Tax=Gemmobacter sp. TaxID=1898957 RepID=UPI001A41F84F|nr:precorrin-3B synthase [Gemmobacter sp.]MBL8560655.1 precorrin-3B synthase [Gemmobacter sp.]
MSGFTVQGWCPGALRPMMSGDGLVVRVRPPLGRMTPAQAQGLADAAMRHGNGLIDLSARGNLQLRGVSQANHAALIADLRALDLVDDDAQAEARRNILVTPFANAETLALARALTQALRQGPDLPGKFGFAVDTGKAPILQDISADIRLERDGAGGLLLRCDGMAYGLPILPDAAAEQAVTLARWFLAQGGMRDGRGRMAALIARGLAPQGATAAPAAAQRRPEPGLQPEGVLVALEFGQMQAETLHALAGLGALRVTPWRMLLIEGARALPRLPGLILDPADPLRRVEACTGAPGCLQAHAPLRDLARRLAPQHKAGVLHLSGCAKGCAHPGRAAVTLVATPAGFDLILNGTAQDAPGQRGLAAQDIDLKGLL